MDGLAAVRGSFLAGLFLAGCADQSGGGAPSAAAVSVTRQALGISPTNNLPTAQTTNEDSPLAFSAVGGNALSITDPDSAVVSVQVNVTNGVFAIGTVPPGVTVTGNGTPSVVISGPILVAGPPPTGINIALDSARFLPAPNYYGPATLQINTTDPDGNVDLDTLPITINSFNDAPVNGAPIAIQNATEDVPYTFALPVNDPDILTSDVFISLTATNSTVITLPPSFSGLTLTVGDGTADTTMAFHGTQANVNAALNGLTITPQLNYIGLSTLTINSNDNGATGAGSPGEDTDVVTFSWAPVNDAPVNTVPSAQPLAEEGSLLFAAGTLMRVDDVDATNGLVQVTLDGTNGSLTLGTPGAVTFGVGDGTADATMTFSGTLVELNTALNGTRFTATPNFAGAASVKISTNDLGSSGIGGVKQDVDTVVITVAGVNDAPVLALPGPQSTNEDAPKVFSVATGSVIGVTDVDAASLEMTLTVTNGVLTLGNRAGLAFQAGDGVSDPTVTFTGPVAAMNTALSGLTFVPNLNYFGAAQLSLSTTDQGSSGTGGALTAAGVVAITVLSVNDVPDAINDILTVAEDSAPTSLAVMANDLTAPDTGEVLTIVAVSLPARGTATINGSNVTYQPQANFNGTDTFTYTVSDGSADPRFDTATVTVTVTAVNDNPTATPDSVTVLQNAGATTVSVLSNDSVSPDVGESLTVTVVSDPPNGLAALTAGGSAVTYTPDTGYAGTDSFTYTISDGNGGVATTTVTVTVTAVNTRPVNTLPVPQQTVEDTQLAFSAVAGNAISVTDANSPTLTVQVQVTNGNVALGVLANLTVTGNATPTVTLQGTLAALNTGLNGMRYQPALNYNGPATLTVTSTDSNGESDTDTLTLTVIAVNDAPTHTVPSGPQAVTEDTPKTFTTLIVGDVDVGGTSIQVSLVADNGTLLALAQTSGLSFTVGDGTSDAAMTFTGTVTSVNAALNGLTVTPPLNFIGNSTLVLTTNDLGNTGGVGPPTPLQDVDTITLAWGAVNDPPINTVPAAQSAAEEQPLTFTAASGNALLIADTDAAAALLQVTLSAATGTLTLGTSASVAFGAGDGTADATMTFTGTLANINAALEGTVFTPGLNFVGATTVTLITNDLGNSGAGGVRQDSDAVTITVAGINDAPVNTVPGPQSTNEDVPRVFGVANALSAFDVDALALQVSVSASSGSVTLGNRTGLAFQSGDGIDDNSVTFIGTVAAVNTALAGLSYQPGANFIGQATLTLFTSDLGSSGTGGTRTASDTVTINVASINDPPDAVNDAVTLAEDALPSVVLVLGNDTAAPDLGEALSITAVSVPARGTASTDGTRITYTPQANFSGSDTFTYTLADGNGGTDTATVTVTVTPVNDSPTAVGDTLTVLQNAAPTAVGVLSNDSSAPDLGETLTVTAVSDPPNGNVAITPGGAAVTYAPDPGFTGTDSFAYTLSDGNGGTATATVSVTVVAVNVNPVNALPTPQQTIEDSALVFSTGSGNPVAVSDANSPTLTVQVSVTGGTFTLATLTGLAITGNGTASVTLQGPVAALNAGLNGAAYTPTPNANGPATLTVNTNDTDGHNDVDVLTLMVVAINDPPVNSAPTGVLAVTEDVPRTFTNVLVADVDVGSSMLEMTLTADNGTRLSLSQIAGLSFSLGDGAADPVMRFTGSVTQINSALNGLALTPPANYIGTSTLVVTTNDLGNSGAGGAGQDTDTINLAWAADNDPPINAVPAAQTVAEETPFTFSATQGRALTVSDVDLTLGTLQVTLSSTNGRLSIGSFGLITFTVGSGTDETTMTFRGPAAAVNAALEGTTFVPNSNFTGAAVVTLLSNDLGNSGGTAKTDSDTVTLTVTPVNDAPVNTLPGPQQIAEGNSLLFNTVNGNVVTVADVDAPSLQVSLSALHGTVSLTATTGLVFQVGSGTAAPTMTFSGTLTSINAALNGLRLTPPPNFEGLTGVTLVSRDLGVAGAGGALFDEDTINVAVVGVNDAPTGVNDAFSLDEDTTLDLAVLANDSSAPDSNEVLQVSAVSASIGTTTINGGTSITYRGAANFTGQDVFTYTLSDGNGGTATATVTVTVRPVNDPPDALDDVLSVPEGSTGTLLAVLANDTAQPDNSETLVVISTTTPAHGTITLGAGVSFRPTAGYSGPDTFMYTVSDGNGGTDSATVTLDITAVDYQPVAAPDALTVVEDGNGTVTVLANDTALLDGPLTVTLATQPTRGTAVAQADNTVLYTPTPDAVGADTFRYTVTDGDGDAATATVTVTITPGNDLPAPVDDVATTAEDTSVKVAVRANDTGLGDLPIVLAVTVVPTKGTTTLEADGTISYQPARDAVGADTFTYSVTDGDAQRGTAVVSVTVTAVNDAPVAVSDAAATPVGAALDADVLANDTDVDGDTLTIASVTTPAHGTATIVAGKVHYVPAATYRGPDQFDYVATDGMLTATATVMLTVGMDSDGDGLEDDAEMRLGTDPRVADTDRDLIVDGLEVTLTRTDPLDDDSDDDGLIDGNEDLNRNGTLDVGETDPNLADTDGDELLDGTEKGLTVSQGQDTASTVFVADLNPATRTDPRVADTDNGGLADGLEDANHNGRVDSGETNPLTPSDDLPRAPDGDGDGVPDGTDNCASVANATQADADDDGVGDACEAPGCGCTTASPAGVFPLALALWGAFVARRRRSAR
ncbi:MAG: Ig-like domain-containing protein [Archangium sp.]|nr:Ig-like domain-containing protein [Archangium sp.]